MNECEDGNLLNGDGCSSTCTVEEGYVCTGGGFDPLAPDVGTFLDICTTLDTSIVRIIVSKSNNICIEFSNFIAAIENVKATDFEVTLNSFTDE